MDLNENTLSHNGVSVRYWTGGQPSAPLVVFTHGALIDHHEWDPTLPLVGERFRLLAWDMPGHGLSRPAAFSMPEAEACLLALLDALGVEQAILVGHSLGGNLHQELVFHHPERVKAMVCVDCTWNFQQLTRPEKLLLSLAEPMFRLFPYKTLIDSSLAVTATAKASQELLRSSMQLQSKNEYIKIMMAATACLHYEPGYTVNKPLLLILGDKDTTGNIRTAMPAWAKVEPDCQLVIVPNAKHAVNLDAPEMFHQTLMDFLLKRCM